jgi:mannose-6-phosphate isomerase-like protein (cupin superfamily)
MGAVIHCSGEGERLEMGPSSLVLHAVGEDTADSFFMSETTLGPGFPGPPLHVHERIHDMFYVLEGTVAFQVEDEQVDLGPGSFVCVAPGTPHRFWNPADQPARFLNLNTPAGFESYMRELAAAGAKAAEDGRQLAPEEIGEIASRYDFKLAG